MKLTNHINVLVTVIVLTTTAAAIAGIPALIQKKSKPVEVVPVEMHTQDEAIIKELYNVVHQLDAQPVITLEGRIEATDLADSTNNMVTDFIYSRSGNKLYYRWGGSEMISLEDIYINISHETKEIFISEPKQVQPAVHLPISDVLNALGAEKYKITRQEVDGKVTVAFANPASGHCRDYQLTYDSTAWITKVHIRMVSEQNPMDKNMDKLITYTMKRYEAGKAKITLLQADHYLRLKDGMTVPAPLLKDYELIKDR